MESPQLLGTSALLLTGLVWHRALAVGALALGSKAAVLLKSGGGLAKVGALIFAGETGRAWMLSVLAKRQSLLDLCYLQAEPLLRSQPKARSKAHDGSHRRCAARCSTCSRHLADLLAHLDPITQLCAE